MPSPSGAAGRRAALLPRVALALVATGIAAAAAWIAWRATRPLMSAAVVEVDAGVETAPAWEDSQIYVVDPVAGHRPRRGAVIRLKMSALEPLAAQDVVKRRCAAGFLRDDDLPSELTDPRVLFLGDSHLDGVVSTADNLTSILERDLREVGQPVWMLNAGCGLYSLWQYVLRARTLVPRYRPAVVVVVVFLGNDLLELEDPRRPHLDDALREVPGDPQAKRVVDAGAMKELDLGPFEQLFWQGFQQADWFWHHPERWPAIRAKAAHAIDAMQALAGAHGARVQWVLLPSADLVFPERLAGLQGRAREFLDAGVQQQIHDDVLALLNERGLQVVDLLPAFRADGSLGLYAIDFHVFERGHRLIASELLPRLRTALDSAR